MFDVQFVAKLCSRAFVSIASGVRTRHGNERNFDNERNGTSSEVKLSLVMSDCRMLRI
jgi:hypothetical protein